MRTTISTSEFKEIVCRVDHERGFTNLKLLLKILEEVNTQLFPVIAEDGSSGEWAIESFSVDKQFSFVSYQAAMAGDWSKFIQEGNYKRLVFRGDVIMSNTIFEYVTSLEFLLRAKGKVLINGLGLGAVLNSLLNNDGVEHITIVEYSIDVINMVAKFYLDNPRVRIVHGDAYIYPVSNYDYIWHDIWPDISTKNLPLMDSLLQRYANHCQWQDAWPRNYLLDYDNFLESLLSTVHELIESS